jgi:hypothetical protein
MKQQAMALGAIPLLVRNTFSLEEDFTRGSTAFAV